MSILKPLISIVLGKDGKSFTFSDNTIEDNRSTSTNYWNGTTPRYNTNISFTTADGTFKPDEIYKVDLFITKPDETVHSFIDIDVPVTSKDLVIENTQINETDIIKDGVYTFDYYIKNQFTTDNAYTGSLGGVTLTFNPEVPQSLEVGMYIVIGSTYYEITELTETTATLGTALGSNVSTTTLTVAYKYQTIHIFDYNIDCCITNTIASATKESCDCVSEQLESAVNMSILLIGAKAQAAKGMKDKAQETIELITKVCNSEDYDCGCK